MDIENSQLIDFFFIGGGGVSFASNVILKMVLICCLDLTFYRHCLSSVRRL